MLITKPKNFSLLTTIESHGWHQLAPFSFDYAKGKLDYTLVLGGNSVTLSLRETLKSIRIAGPLEESSPIVKTIVRRILRLDEPFEEFYLSLESEPRFSWIGAQSLGPLMRSATVYEDLVKTICTTNCSWSLTKQMVSNLVEKLGTGSPSGKKSFPTPFEMAGADVSFYEGEIRAGYRSRYLAELARSVAEGRIDPESWLSSDLPTPQLKKEIKSIVGVGDYAAEHMLKMVGRYDGLALDSFLRGGFYKKHNNGKECPDSTIHAFYKKFGEWRGLVIWFDMIRKDPETE